MFFLLKLLKRYAQYKEHFADFRNTELVVIFFIEQNSASSDFAIVKRLCDSAII